MIESKIEIGTIFRCSKEQESLVKRAFFSILSLFIHKWFFGNLNRPSPGTQIKNKRCYDDSNSGLRPMEPRYALRWTRHSSFFCVKQLWSVGGQRMIRSPGKVYRMRECHSKFRPFFVPFIGILFDPAAFLTLPSSGIGSSIAFPEISALTRSFNALGACYCRFLGNGW